LRVSAKPECYNYLYGCFGERKSKGITDVLGREASHLQTILINMSKGKNAGGTNQNATIGASKRIW
jgi:hypothetical protein